MKIKHYTLRRNEASKNYHNGISNKTAVSSLNGAEAAAHDKDPIADSLLRGELHTSSGKHASYRYSQYDSGNFSDAASNEDEQPESRSCKCALPKIPKLSFGCCVHCTATAALMISFLLIHVYLYYVEIAELAPDHKVFSLLPPKATIAYRGSKRLWPENTVFAFSNAIAMGADALEFDVQMSQDKELVLIREEKLDAVTNSKGLVVRDMTLAQIQSHDVGETWGSETRYSITSPDVEEVSTNQTFPYKGIGIRVPTLTEVFTLFPLIIKNIFLRPLADKSLQRELYQNVCELIELHNQTDRVFVTAFLEEYVKGFQRVCPGVAVTGSVVRATQMYIASRFFMEPGITPLYEGLAVPFRILTERLQRWVIVDERFVEAAHGRNLRMFGWTTLVGETEEQKQVQLMFDVGVDGVVSSRIDISLKERGLLNESAFSLISDEIVRSVPTSAACNETARTNLATSSGCTYLGL
eukprot:CAMPEP_0204873958 /NCGR_PEP_ID=MMETSP1348-20121228/42017_1 /ASSEMBLY_ACC=CAM_ASM_000700 /TAXON_ID=215587 /ORGANISM="Aplanochytrium stocchinoi, Strain GSBS06" /LENGTH=468 /DNA_ID=CAMNT_0052029537 /DNA_START=78 /DNA_END=1484 /DNA_ORIENTATION=-